jgi:hypothetical protein
MLLAAFAVVGLDWLDEAFCAEEGHVCHDFAGAFGT